MATNILKRDRNLSRPIWSGWNFNLPANMDFTILISIVLLMIISLATLHSASTGNIVLVIKQAAYYALGFAVMIVVARVEIYHFRSLPIALYVLGLILLVLVLLIGKEINGSKRWIDLGLINFQPSEFMKFALPLAICSVLTYKPLPISFNQLLTVICLVLLPIGLIFLQPDLGTAMIMVFSSGCLVFLAGLNLRTAMFIITLFLTSIPFAWIYMLHDYHKSRILSFLNPEIDPLNTGWSVIQSKIAVGTGGIFGKGWGNSQQANYEFLPEAHTDFIFSVFAEEHGLLGVFVLLTIYLAIIFRGLTIAVEARNSFEKLFCGCLVFTLCCYLLINMGMVTGVLPVVGVPLPLVSYGGTSLVTLMAAFGVLMSVASHSHKVV